MLYAQSEWPISVCSQLLVRFHILIVLFSEELVNLPFNNKIYHKHIFYGERVLVLMTILSSQFLMMIDLSGERVLVLMTILSSQFLMMIDLSLEHIVYFVLF